MFFTPDMRALRRGRRVAERNPACRPCVVWLKDMPETTYYGVVMDINRFGMRVRMMDMLPPQSQIIIQLMKDEDFKMPLARPIEAVIARVHEVSGLSDHGVRVAREEKKPVEPDTAAQIRNSSPPSPASHMFTMDIVRRTDGRQSGR